MLNINPQEYPRDVLTHLLFMTNQTAHLYYHLSGRPDQTKPMGDHPDAYDQ